MEGVEVPSYFICPISFQIMRDPVTLPSGVTYDRENIERWLFTCKNSTCPLTKLPISDAVDSDILTPNHTLRRLIQAWCIANASHGVERFPTPKPPVTRSHIADLIADARSAPTSSLPQPLRKLKSIISDSDRNRRVVESSPDALDFLASVVEECAAAADQALDDDQEQALDEALSVLYALQISQQGFIRLLEKRPDFVDETLTRVLQVSSYQCRAYSVLLLRSMISAVAPVRLANLKEEFLVEIVKVIKDRVSYQSTRAALHVLNAVVHWGSNRSRVVAAGAVAVLVELLLEEQEKRGAEVVLAAVARLAECAEGRAEIVGHAAGIAAVGRKLVRVSVAASEAAVRVMHLIASHAPAAGVLREMAEVGAVSKMCLLIQADCGAKTKERVREMLRLHARVWRGNPCVSPHLHSCYP